jgi:DNA-binding NtrC family response regulator
VVVPPLRERSEDIPLLVQAFIERYAAKIGRPVRRVSEATLARLCAHPWPGNVRELENVIERALILSRGDVLEVAPELLPAGAASVTAPRVAVVPRAEPSGSLQEAQRAHIVATLERTGWRIEGEQGAAAVLGLRPSTLRSRMQKLRITHTRNSDGA